MTGRRVATLAIGVAAALAPISAALATTNAKHSSSTKGANPNSALCKDLRAEQSSSTSIGNSIASSIESGNFSKAKKDIVSSINAGLRAAAPALSALRSAPGKVQNAMKGLIQFDGTLKKDVQHATGVSGLESTFTTLGNNAKLRSEATTVTNYITSQCGSLLATTTTTVAP
jgi:hypothetical protein